MTTRTEPLDSPARGAALARTMIVILVWFFVDLALGLRGAFRTTGGPPLAIGIALGAPPLLYWIDGRLGHPLLGAIAGLAPPTLALLQTFRVIGVVFIIAWAGGALPSGFALPAGIGDLCVGISAPFVAAALTSGKPYARRLFLTWNVLGLVDLLTAVFLGIAHSRTTFGFLAATPTTDAIAAYPLSMVPSFFVPLAVILHAIGLAQLRRAPGGR